MRRMSVGIESGFSSEEVLNIRFPLHRACRDGDVGALCSILQCTTNQADLAVEDSFYGWTPLHWAAHFGKLECVMRLVQVGCGVNLETSRFAQTPTHIAAFGGHPDCLLWLLQAGADINRQDYVGESPIHKAARAGSIDCINALLMRGAKADCFRVSSRFSLCQYWRSRVRGNSRRLRPGARLTAPSWNRGLLLGIRFYIDARIDTRVSLRNASGLTAADLAHAQGFQECAQLLANAQNQQLNCMTNGSSTNGSIANGDQAITQLRSFLKGAPSRKRSLDSMEPDHIKKARTDTLQFPMKALNGCAQEDLMEAMHMESCSAAPTTGDLHGSSLQAVPQPFSTVQANRNGFPGNCVDLMADTRHGGHLGNVRDAIQTGNIGNGLHFGNYHGLGDTAENIEDGGSEMDHHTSVKAEEHYDHMLYSTMLLYHGC
ncbi:ankyrin repeat domain-containing protein 10b isoform X1 [Alosa sapidissima]|uniref:ankyrin repeat domain-containing protein 10b isoform X1 n=1 Tax=Alosa sapidissima TaxID=34773 RepID=UPI001C09FAFC|nr:ankyrin repeat domain-containing protein 10b isoform X1 [Alosa sapidissima]